jgi:hypothetical protein
VCLLCARYPSKVDVADIIDTLSVFAFRKPFASKTGRGIRLTGLPADFKSLPARKKEIPPQSKCLGPRPTTTAPAIKANTGALFFLSWQIMHIHSRRLKLSSPQ